MNRAYEILHKDTLVAVWKDETLTVINEQFLPYFLKRVSNADLWLETRAIDAHRPHSRLLKKALRLQEKDDISTVLYANGVTITDNYWVREIDSNLHYDDVKFTGSKFATVAANLSLTGSLSQMNYLASHQSKRVQELTNIGSFEKCWKFDSERNQWYMLKSATQLERFSEVFICRLGKALGFSMAEYEVTQSSRRVGAVKSWDFTGNMDVDFEPTFYFMGDNEDYIDTIEMLKKICPNAIKNYVQMLFLDTIIANPDRHTANFGLLRDAKTSEYLGLAPLFDHNMALVSRGYPKTTKVSEKDLLILLFTELLEKYPKYREYLPTLKHGMLLEIIDQMQMQVKKSFVVDFVMNRYEALMKRRS